MKRCYYRQECGLWAPLQCGREAGHTGVHIDFRPNVSIGFGPMDERDRPTRSEQSLEGAAVNGLTPVGQEVDPAHG